MNPAAALRGVNLGGWLVTERWMTPALYEGVSGAGERAIARQLGADVARRRLTEHRETFISGSDFSWIAGRGFDFVRLPVGYWLFDEVGDASEGFLPGAEYVDQAFSWADRYGLRVLLDLHGLPGSQNGQDHSGEVGAVRWREPGNLAHALRTVAMLARRYGRQEALLGLELINEPRLRLRSGVLLRYYEAAYDAVAEQLRADRVVVVSDGFQARRMALALDRRRRRGRFGGDRVKVVLDVHLYRLFTAFARRATIERHLRVVQHDWAKLLQSLSRRLPVLVGEWTATLPRRVGQNLDEATRRRTTEAFCTAQLDTFDAHSWAHAYWSYKTLANTGAWNLRDSDLPFPPHDRT